MQDPYVGEIAWVTFDFAPDGWLVCDGRQLSINQYQALYAILGIRYGGDGRTFFNVPDLRGRIPLGAGQSTADGHIYPLAQKGGASAVQLNSAQLPAHNHSASFVPSGTTPITGLVEGTFQALTGVADTDLSSVPTNDSMLANTYDSDAGGGHPQLYANGTSSSTSVNLGGLSITSKISGGFTGGTVSISYTGGNAPVPTIPPYLALTPLIAYEGIFPVRP